MENSPKITKRPKSSKGSKTTKNPKSVTEPKTKEYKGTVSITSGEAAKSQKFHEEDHKNKMAYPNLE